MISTKSTVNARAASDMLIKFQDKMLELGSIEDLWYADLDQTKLFYSIIDGINKAKQDLMYLTGLTII